MLSILLFLTLAGRPESKPPLSRFLKRYAAPARNGSKSRITARPYVSHRLPETNEPRLLWQTKLDGQNFVTLGPASPDVLLIQTSPMPPNGDWPPDWTKLGRYYYGLEVATGRPRWQSHITDEPDLREAVFGEGLFFVPTYPRDNKTAPNRPYDREELRAISPVTGRTVWSAPCALSGTHIIAHDNVVVYQNIDRTTTGADSLTGRLLWRFPTQSPSDCSPARIALGNVYFYGFETDPGYGADVGGEYLAVVDLKTGQEIRRARFYKRFNSLTHLEHLEWLPDVNRFVGEVETVGAGVARSDMQATDRDLKPIWERPSTGAFAAIGNTLVCEYESDPQIGPPYEAGLIGLDAATGRELWRRRGSGGTFLGVWNNVIVLRGGRGDDMLFGLRPQNGATAWTLDLKASSEVERAKSLPTATQSGIQFWELSARISGKYLIIGESSRTGQPVKLRVYVPAGK